MCAQYRVTKNYALFLVLNIFLFGCLVAQEKFQNRNALLPVSSIQAIKQSMTGVQKKLGTDLLQLIDQKYLPEGVTFQSHAESMGNLNQYRYQGKDILQSRTVNEGEVYVYIYLESNVLTEVLNPFVTKITDRDELHHIVVAWIKVKDLENLASLSGVKHVQSVVPPVINTGSVTTQGDSIHKTVNVRRIYSQSGTGIKVGIISDGVDHRSSAQTTNDLPADSAGLTVLSNTVGGDEGTAMLEIVHDMVPGSELYFHDCGTNILAFNTAIDALVSAGCKVICDDISWITEPFFEDGTVASHVASVLSSNNIIYVSSAGNAGDSHYQGDYYPQPSSKPYHYHDFSRGNSGLSNLYIKMTVGSTVRIVLEWNDKFGSSGNDYDLYLAKFNNFAQVASSYNPQDGSGDPLEWISYTASTAGDYAVMVDKYSGADKTLEVYIYPGIGTDVYTNNLTPVDAIFGQPAVVGTIAVGAVRATTTDTIEYFSSQGPVTISFPSSQTRTKPDICGVDGVTITGAGGFGYWDGANWRFYGTSAAAPHVAAATAQMWAAFPGKTGNQIRDAIKSTADDLGTVGFDNIYGWGRVDAFNSYGALPVELVSFTISVEHSRTTLKWETVTEVNNYGFDVERRKLGNLEWDKIGFVPGNGVSNTPHQYSFEDTKYITGKIAYRLKQIDKDGTFKYSQSVEVEGEGSPNAFSLAQNYPNPFNPSTIIHFDLPVRSRVKLEVFNILGQSVATLIEGEKDAGFVEAVWHANVSSGLYLYRIEAISTENPNVHFVDMKKMLLLK